MREPQVVPAVDQVVSRAQSARQAGRDISRTYDRRHCPNGVGSEFKVTGVDPVKRIGRLVVFGEFVALTFFCSGAQRCGNWQERCWLILDATGLIVGQPVNTRPARSLSNALVRW